MFTKLSSGSDIRRIASQNVGTTNVMLNVGWLPGLLTMIGDVGKGVAVGLLADLCPIRWVRALRLRWPSSVTIGPFGSNSRAVEA